jgi:hypothetical protein
VPSYNYKALRLHVRPVVEASKGKWGRTVGNCFPKVPSCNYKALRLHVWPVVEASKGKWGSRRIVEQRRGTLPRVGQACGE